MSKKNFKGGLDSLFSSVGLEKNENKIQEEFENLDDEKKHWLIIKISRLKEELKLWRTGKIDVETFNKSLEESGLSYNEDTNEIE